MTARGPGRIDSLMADRPTRIKDALRNTLKDLVGKKLMSDFDEADGFLAMGTF